MRDLCQEVRKEIRDLCQEIRQEIRDLRQEVRELTAKASNSSASFPTDCLEAILNDAGAAPPQNKFPETLQHLIALSLPHCNSLIAHYGLPDDGDVAAKRRRVGSHIGVRAYRFV
jgi:hypothetical protein